MFTRADIKPLSVAAASAAAAGLALGLWAAPPASLAEPAFHPEAQAVLADDPNLAAYKQMIAEQGGPGPLYVVSSYAPPVAAAPAEPDPAALLEVQLAREAAAFEQQALAWRAEREAWLERHRAEQTGMRPLPAAYAEALPPAAPAGPEAESPTATEASPSD